MEAGVPVQRQYLAGPYGQVHLYRAGQPGGQRPLVCFHQSPLSGRTFDALMREMGRDRLVLALDTPGYGQSDAPPEPLTIAGYAEAHGAVIDPMELGPIDVLGVHTGARIAVEFARKRREQVRHIVLVGAAVYTEEERAAQRQWIGQSLAPTEGSDGTHVLTMWKNWAQYRGAGVTDAMIERYLSDSLRQRGNAGFAMQAVFAHDMGAALRDLDQPMLVFNVRDDIYEATRRSAACLKNGRVVDLSPTGLWPLETRTQEIAEMIRSHCAA